MLGNPNKSFVDLGQNLISMALASSQISCLFTQRTPRKIYMLVGSMKLHLDRLVHEFLLDVDYNG